MKKVFQFVLPYSPLLVTALLLLVLSGLLDAAVVVLLEPIFNQLAPGDAAQVGAGKFSFLHEFLNLSGDNRFLRVALFLVIFAFFKGLFLYLAEYSMSYTGQRVVAELRTLLYDRLLQQSLAFYSEHPTGKLMARVISDTERLQETVSKTLTDFIRQNILLLFFLGIVFYIDWKLALLSFLIGPLVLVITVNLGRRIRKVSLRSQESLSDISHALQETISGQKIVKAFNMEEYEKGKFLAQVERLVGTNLRVARISALSSPLVEFIGYVAFVPFLLYANYQVNRGFTIGAFVVFVAALFRLYEPVRKLSRMHLYFQQASASAERVFELIDWPVEVQEAPHAYILPPFGSEIVFSDVSFSYPGDSPVPVLKEINLNIRKGEIIALVGSSGAGKTSLVSLLPRFYDVSEGVISVDQHDIREVTLSSLRSQIAIVTQDTFLFNDTVRKNIAYGREDCSLEEVSRAADAAFIHEFITELPEGYDTYIGERGERLSGGQRQRIAIARAVLKNAPILILDEATSALDTESERLVQKALSNLMRHCTTVVIAHRLSTVQVADRILVMDDGRIVEEGRHENLLKASGIYRKLYELQFADVSAVIGSQR